MIGMKIIYGYKIKEIRQIGINKELDEIVSKYPNNIDICKKYLKMLKNEMVQVEENKDSDTSLYIAISNKICIANIRESYTRIQTIAHECLHSVQDRKLLMFNFVFSNIYIFCFLIIAILKIFNILPYEDIFFVIFVLMGLLQYSVKSYLENDAMIKARYLSKDYMIKEKISTQGEVDKTVNEFDEINKIGIKCTNCNLLLSVLIKDFVIAMIYGVSMLVN